MKEVERLENTMQRIYLAFIAYAFGHLDVSARALCDRATGEHLMNLTGVSPERWVQWMNQKYYRHNQRSRRQERRRSWLRRLKRREV